MCGVQLNPVCGVQRNHSPNAAEMSCAGMYTSHTTQLSRLAWTRRKDERRGGRRVEKEEDGFRTRELRELREQSLLMKIFLCSHIMGSKQSCPSVDDACRGRRAAWAAAMVAAVKLLVSCRHQPSMKGMTEKSRMRNRFASLTGLMCMVPGVYRWTRHNKNRLIEQRPHSSSSVA